MKNSPASFTLLQVQARVQSVDSYAIATVTPVENSTRSLDIPKALEGDLWQLSISKKKRRLHLLEAKLEEPGPARIKARCKHFDVCGGCQWQHISLQDQRLRKEAFVLEALKSHITSQTKWRGVDFVDQSWRYRNKIELTFRQTLQGERFLGFYAGKFRVVDVVECQLTGLWSERAIDAARQWWSKHPLQAYHPGSDRGTLRQLTLRQSHHTRDKMAILTVSAHPDWAITKHQIDSFKEAMVSSIEEGDVLSVYLIVHQAIRGQPTRLFEWHLYGPETIRENLEILVPNSGSLDEKQAMQTLEFAISPTTFFQPNTLSAQKLYSWALTFACLEGKKALVWDLFCGSGTLSLALAASARQVIGVEVNPMAVLDAQANAVVNKVTNAHFECFDLHKSPDLACKKIIEDFGHPDVVVVDPPRAGVMEKGIELLSQIAPSLIVYVSCNPLTQAKDIEGLKKRGYQLVEFVAVDQFPHTGHIETVCLLKKEIDHVLAL